MGITHMLNSTMTVQRPTVSNTGGRKSKAWSAHLSGVACRAHQLSGSELARYGAERGVNRWRFSVEPGNDIKRTDRILFTDRDGVLHTVDVDSSVDSSQGMRSLSTIRVIEGEEVTSADQS